MVRFPKIPFEMLLPQYVPSLPDHHFQVSDRSPIYIWTRILCPDHYFQVSDRHLLLESPSYAEKQFLKSVLMLLQKNGKKSA